MIKHPHPTKDEIVVAQMKERHKQMMQQQGGNAARRMRSNGSIEDDEMKPLDAKLVKLISTLLCRVVIHDPRSVAAICRNDPEVERRLVEMWIDMDNRRNIAFIMSGFTIEMPDPLEVRLPHVLVLLEALVQRHPLALSSVAQIIAQTVSVMTQKEAQSSSSSSSSSSQSTPSELLQGLEKRLFAIESADLIKRLDLRQCLAQAVDVFVQISGAADLEGKLSLLSPSLPSILRKILNGESASSATSEDHDHHLHLHPSSSSMSSS